MRAFTTTYKEISDSLKNEIVVLNKFKNSQNKYMAIWDTGANNTVITQRVVDECGLIPIAKTEVGTAGGTVEDANVYVVDLILPDNLVISNLPVVGLQVNNSDLLIGMDVINKGDFSVSNYLEQTKFTFRTPSLEHADYVKNQTICSSETIGRNSLCHCRKWIEI